MTLEDLEHIFEPQIMQDYEDDVVKLFFIVQDGEVATVLRHLSTDLPGLLPMLSGYQYHGTHCSIPRFVK